MDESQNTPVGTEPKAPDRDLATELDAIKAELNTFKAAFVKLCNITGESNSHVNAKALAESLCQLTT